MGEKQIKLNKNNKKTATALVVTVEKFWKDSLTDYQTQGVYKPYTKCRTSSILRMPAECLSGYKDIKKSIRDLKRVLNKWNIEDTHTFVFVISKIVGAEPSVERVRIAKNVDEISYYLNLPQYSFRLGLHNLKAKNYQGNRQKKSNYGVTFKELNLPNTFEAKDGVNVVEYVYVYWTSDRLKKVAEAILHLLETSEWDETIAPADAINYSPMKRNEKVEGVPFDGAKNTKKTATALAITVLKSSSFITLPQPFKRRSTTTKPRLATCTVNGISAKANIKQFIDSAKFLALFKDFNIESAEDFIECRVQ